MTTGTLAYTGQLIIETCWCGIVHAVPSSLIEEQKRQFNRGEKQRGIFCPLGHTWIRVGKTEKDKREEAEARETHLKDQLEAAQREAEAARVRLMQERERWSKGMCPCCRRNFPALAQHVRTEHPDFDPSTMKKPTYECSCNRKFETMHGLRIHQGRQRPWDWWKPGQYAWRAHTTVTR